MRLISGVLAVQNFVNRVDSGEWSTGVLECWWEPIAHFSTTPLLHYSNSQLFIDKVPAIPYKNSAAAPRAGVIQR
jgi:hypothetical protein